MGRLEIVYDDKVLFDYPVDSYTLTERGDTVELSATFQPLELAPTGAAALLGPAVGNLPLLGEPPPGWSPDDPDPEVRDV